MLIVNCFLTPFFLMLYFFTSSVSYPFPQYSLMWCVPFLRLIFPGDIFGACGKIIKAVKKMFLRIQNKVNTQHRGEQCLCR